MSGALYYPPADRSQWYGPGNATVAPDKVLWHSTETPGGWPSYAGGSMAPNLTYDPWIHQWRQHFPLNGTARALANGPGYSTNRVGPCQVEVSCYCDPARFSTGRGIDRLDDQAYADMAAFAAFMHVEWGIPLHVGVSLKPYPSSYGQNGVRLDGPTFRDYAGHCCHMHAPYNDHGDSGAMDIARIVSTTTNEQEPDMTPEQAQKLDEIHFAIARLEQLWGEGSGRPHTHDETHDWSLQTTNAVGRIEATTNGIAAEIGG